MVTATALVFLTFCYSSNAFLFENDVCKINATNEYGKCIRVCHCQYAQKLLQKRQFPELCGFSGKEPLVCCPQVLQQLRADATKERDYDCILEGTQEKEGKCINIDQCEQAKQTSEVSRQLICGFGQDIPVVCCPEPIQPKILQAGDISRRECIKYFQMLNWHGCTNFSQNGKRKYECTPTRRRLIELGERALWKEFPHMVAIGYGANHSSLLWLCGGSLISPYFVLSAAHCAYALDHGPAKYARFGVISLGFPTHGQDLKIVQIHVHPDYKASSYYYDIALFKLEWAMSDYDIACLHTRTSISVDNLQATGWGRLGFNGDLSNHLMKVNLSLVDFGTCRKKYENVSRRRLKNGILDNYQICAGSSKGGDTCEGDSGGPLQYKVQEYKAIGEHFVIAGITSFGQGCGGKNSTGIYTRVSAHLGWIEGIVWPSQL